jgi:hypothetical protein
MMTGVTAASYVGVGVVIDAEKGLVICDRDTVPMTLGDVTLSVAGSVLINATIVFLHPIHNFSILRYDPSLLGTTPLRSATFSKHILRPGDPTYYVGISKRNSVLSHKCFVTRKEPLVLSLDARPPRFTAKNVELLHMDKVSSGLGGVFADTNGDIQALWSSYSYQRGKKNGQVFRGVPIELLAWTINTLRGVSAISFGNDDISSPGRPTKGSATDGNVMPPAPSSTATMAAKTTTPSIPAATTLATSTTTVSAASTTTTAATTAAVAAAAATTTTTTTTAVLPTTAPANSATEPPSPITVRRLRSGTLSTVAISTPIVHDLQVEFGLIALAQARDGMGLSSEWGNRLSSKHSDVRQVLQINRVVATSSSSQILKTGDLLLAIDGEPCCTFRDVELAVHEKIYVDIDVVRGAQEERVRVPVTRLGSDDTTRMVQWAGMLLEPTYPAITMSTGFVPKEVREGTGVYCSRWCYGSPSHMYGLRASSWIISVNGMATPDLETFLDVINRIESGKKMKVAKVDDGEDDDDDDNKKSVPETLANTSSVLEGEEEFVRLVMVNLTGQKQVYTLQPDLTYWPSMDLKRQIDGVWQLER